MLYLSYCPVNTTKDMHIPFREARFNRQPEDMEKQIMWELHAEGPKGVSVSKKEGVRNSEGCS